MATAISSNTLIFQPSLDFWSNDNSFIGKAPLHIFVWILQSEKNETIVDISGQIMYNDQTAEVTLNGGIVRESSQNPLNSGLGIIVICPDIYIHHCFFRLRGGQTSESVDEPRIRPQLALELERLEPKNGMLRNYHGSFTARGSSVSNSALSSFWELLGERPPSNQEENLNAASYPVTAVQRTTNVQGCGSPIPTATSYRELGKFLIGSFIAGSMMEVSWGHVALGTLMLMHIDAKDALKIPVAEVMDSREQHDYEGICDERICLPMEAFKDHPEVDIQSIQWPENSTYYLLRCILHHIWSTAAGSHEAMDTKVLTHHRIWYSKSIFFWFFSRRQ